MQLIFSILRFILYLYDLPFRMLCDQVGKDTYIGLGYALLFSDKKGVKIGNNVSISTNAVIQTVKNDYCENPKLIIDDSTMIGKDFFCSAAKSIRIGKNCLFSWRVTILDHDHVCDTRNMPIVQQGVTEGKEIVIGDNTFVGIGAVILKGVTLGKHCVVGANSVVTKSFPDYSVIAGSPAKLIKSLK